ncbi:hypothetical protein WANA31_0487 [Wolbachia endosymbiont of Drosophila ananassae]|nr:hypothetical protein WANA31_0487 [Wolbachia endosymbiont of Drosophila ananassae]
METKGSQSFPKSPIYCFLNHSPERIPYFTQSKRGNTFLERIISLYLTWK